MEYNDIVNNLFKDIDSNPNNTDNIEDITAPWSITNNGDNDSDITSDSNNTSDSNSDETDNALDIDIKYDEQLLERNHIYNIQPQVTQIYKDIDVNNDTDSEDDSEESDLFSQNDSLEDYSTNIKINKLDDVKLEKNPLDYLHNDADNLSIDLFEKKIEEVDYHIIIENTYKDTDGSYTIFDPNSTVKTVELDRTFNNIVKADLIECIIKNNAGSSYATDPSGTPFILVEVDEFGSNYISNNSNIGHAFKTLAYYVELNSGTTLKHYTDLSNTIETYFNPRKTLDSITLRFKKPDGTNFTFSGSSITTATYWLTFKITCLERRLKTSYLNKTTG